MAKITAPGYHCPHCGYSTPSYNHIGCGGVIMLNTDTGVQYCACCGETGFGGNITCRKCGKKAYG